MTKPHSASMAGQDTPKNEEARSTPHAEGLKDQEITEQAEYQAIAPVCASAPRQNPISEDVSQSDDQPENLASLQDWAALRGYSIEHVRGAGGIDILTANGSGTTRELHNQDELASFIVQAGREQQDVAGAQIPPSVIEQRLADWAQYRDQCFIRCSVEPIWVWTAAHEFEFCHVGLFLADVPGAKIDLGMQAMSIHVFDHWHVVPLARMTVKSMEHLASVSTFSPVDRRAELMGAQVAAENVLRGQVDQRFLFKAAPGSLNGTLQ